MILSILGWLGINYFNCTFDLVEKEFFAMVTGFIFVSSAIVEIKIFILILGI